MSSSWHVSASSLRGAEGGAAIRPVARTSACRALKSGGRGFTLLELSVVLTLIGVIIGGGLVTFTASVQATQFNKTVARMNAIDQAVLNYAVSHYRIPCPSDLTLLTGSTNYGIEAANAGTCTGGTPAANYAAASGTVEGGVPTRTLQLPDDYIYDGWGRRLRYAVDPVYTAAGSLPAYPSCFLTPTPTTSAITVSDASGAARTSVGVYALISHGANGHGGYTSGGAMVNAGSTNTNELANCHCTSSAAASTYTPTYVQMAPALDSTNSFNGFDDIVTYKDAWHLQTANSPLAGSCAYTAYVGDYGNNRVAPFNSNGSYITPFTLPHWNASMAADPSGNLWISDSSYTIQEYSAAGTLITQFGTSGSADGNFSSPKGIVFDPGGTMWVVDSGNNRVEQFTSAQAFVAGIGAGYNGVSGSKGASGSVAGAFNAPSLIALDPGGNIWVVDGGNNRIQKFNGGSLAWMLSIAFTGPVGLAVDTTGNVWVSSASAIKKFDGTAGTLLKTCTFASGSGNGQVQNMLQIAIDANNNIWAVDSGNNRVQIFNNQCTYEGAVGAGYNGASGSVGASGSGNGQLNAPVGLAISR